MLRTMLALVVVGVLAASTPDDTGWLAAGHPRVTLRFERTTRSSCTPDCEYFGMLLAYRGAVPATHAQDADWNAVANAQCVDVVLPARSTFACRGPGSLAGTSKSGQPYATSHFHVKREMLQDMTNPAAVLRIQSLSVKLPGETRAALAAFLREERVALGD